jgi:G:T/U-mismatch repair DNA glycosylase
MGASMRRPVQIDEGAEIAASDLGQKAKYLLEDETLLRAFAELEAAMMAQWRTSTADDVDLREAAFVRVAALDDIRGKLRSWVTSGEKARDQLQKLRAQRERELERRAPQVA